MTADPVRAALSGLMVRLGTDLARDAGRCQTQLDEACSGKFAVRRAALLAAVEHSVAGDLLSGLSSSEPKSALLDRLSRRLTASAPLSPFLARWSVESWAVALGVVPESDRLLVAKLDAVLQQIDEAIIDGAITHRDFERIVAMAGRSGLEEADIRDFVAEYVAGRGWRRGDPDVPEARAAPNSLEEPEAVPAATPSAPVRPPAVVLVRAGIPRTPLFGMPPWRIVTVLGLAAFAVLAAILLRRPAQTSYPVPEQRHQIVADQGHPHQQAALTDEEGRAYDAAHGNPTALQRYIDTCRICAFATEARAELRRLKAAADDEQAYQQAAGNIAALLAYAQGCDVCAFKTAALDEIAKLEAQPPPAAPSGEIQFRLYQHHDAPGNDILPLDGQEPDRSGCAAACARTNECVAYTYDRWNRACYLKRGVGTLFLNPKAATGVRGDGPSPSLSEEPVQIDRYRRKWFPDTPYSTPADNSLPACENACRSDEVCMAYTFLSSPQRCLLFNHPGQYFNNDDAVSGVKGQPY